VLAENDSAITSMDWQGARVPFPHAVSEENTRAPAVAPPLTELHVALDPLRIPFSPLRPDRWEYYLDFHNITDDFPDVVEGIRAGFSLNSSIKIDKTIIYKNHRSAIDNPDVIKAVIAKEVAANRYLGPYTREEMELVLGRPFIAHPLGVVPKPNGKFRLVEDLSYPHDGSFPSVNSLTSIDDVPVDWGGMADAIRMVVTAKEGAQGAVFDWGEAFRNIGVKEDDQWMGIIGWVEKVAGDEEEEEELFWRDRASKFGHARSTGNFDRVNAAFVRILTLALLIFILRWVDDLCIRREPIEDSPPFSYHTDIDDILLIADDLGVPLPTDKITPFANEVKYIGFIWVFDAKEVFIPDEKRTKAAEELSDLASKSSITLKALRSVCGRLSHFSLVVLDGRVHLRGLYTMLAAMEARKTHDLASWDFWEGAWKDVSWWAKKLAGSRVGMKLCTQLVPDDSLRIFVDASTSYGIGVVIGTDFDRFKLAADWRASGGEIRDIGFLEFAAVELAIFFLISSFNISNRHLLIHSDNQGVIQAWAARSSRNPTQNRICARLLHLLSSRQCFLTLEYVQSANNPADLPSRGLDLAGYRRRTFKGFPTALRNIVFRD
jgi:hypothetical protein